MSQPTSCSYSKYGTSFGLFVVVTLSASPAAGQGCAPVLPSLVSSWDASAVSNRTVPDVKGRNPGLIVGSVSVIDGKNVQAPQSIGKLFYFNGSSYIDMHNAADFQFGTGPFSLEAFFMWDGRESPINNAKGSTINNIIRKSTYPLRDLAAGYWIRINQTTRTLEFFVGETVGALGLPRASLTASITPNTWYHVVGTKAPSGMVTLHLNGQQVDTRTISPTFSLDSGAPFTIGAWNDRFGLTELFSGYIATISVYNAALPLDQVKALFETGGSGKCIQ